MTTAEKNLERLVGAHQSDLWAYLRVLGCSADEADDLVQESFLVLLRKRDGVRDGGAAAFLRRTARQLFLTAHRRTRRRDAILRADAAEALWRRRLGGGDEASGLSGLSGFSGFLTALRACLETLDPEARGLLDLRYGRGLGGAAMAREVGRTVSDVNTMLHRCRARLRTCIQRRTSHD